MKLNIRSLAKAVLVIVLLAVLPVVGQQYVPAEFYRAFSVQMGLKIGELLNRIALVAIILSVLIIVRGHLEKSSETYLAVSAIWKVSWLFIVFFALGIGYPETLGQAVLGGKSEAAENIVVFDFRLFAALATAVVALMIVRSIIQFRESPQAVPEQSKSKPSPEPRLNEKV